MLRLSEEQKKELEMAGVHEQALEVFWRIRPECTFVTAVGGVEAWLKGAGQVRTERWEPADVPSEEFTAANVTDEKGDVDENGDFKEKTEEAQA